ncbi:hypothetical protein EXIGLDRAFT_763485 [Exidia glandulosa HHB12029]|uniref:Uncharacterized protein n=1 Tax=Exidia glandulosa HHB12029 TaxID=1314781 RepID=A0A165LXY5_EXIGL|nr:hypothetical protein EXIGLDRAFT_763485 [Exidia glandulosa HHB12029]
MTGRDLTATLPPELIGRFFRGWTFQELRPTLGVCARWREIGLNHPIYWRSITLKGPRYNSVLLSLLRVERTYGRPFSWTIDALTPPGTLRRIVSAVSAHLEQLVALEIRVQNVYAQTVFAALRLPASQLTTFRLEFWASDADPDATAPRLTSDLFAQCAPKLRKVGLCGVDLAERLPIFGVGRRLLLFPRLSGPKLDPD